ncbi:hypothetical protein TNCV_2766701 [Trichonephila clavipes]|nr:hypothetical protein TNCV_2766701 [Trichonephila clavipes]
MFINIALQSNTRATGDRYRNFEPQPSDWDLSWHLILLTSILRKSEEFEQQQIERGSDCTWRVFSGNISRTHDKPATNP